MDKIVIKLVVYSVAVVCSVLSSPTRLDHQFGHRQVVQEVIAPVQQHQQVFSSEGVAVGKQVQGGFVSGSSVQGGFVSGPSDINEDIRDGPFWDGSYYFRYVTADGTVREEGGRPAADGSLIVTGSYAYAAPNGEIIAYDYIADSQGYRAYPKGTNPEYVAPQRVTDPGLPPSRGQVFEPAGFGGGNNNFIQGRAGSLNLVSVQDGSSGLNGQVVNAARSFSQQQDFSQHRFQ